MAGGPSYIVIPKPTFPDEEVVGPNNPLPVRDWLLALAGGSISGISTESKFGRNYDVDIGTEDVWGAGGTWAAPVTAAQVLVASSSTFDVSTSTGTATIQITGLDQNYAIASETLTMNGTAVVTTALSYNIIHRIVCATGGSNVGTITATSTADGTPVLITITIGKGQTQFGIYQVPAGKTAYLYKFGGSINGGQNTNIDLELFAKPFGGVWNLNGALVFSINGTSTAERVFATPIVYTEKTTLKLTATSDVNNADVVGFFDLILVDN